MWDVVAYMLILQPTYKLYVSCPHSLTGGYRQQGNVLQYIGSLSGSDAEVPYQAPVS